MHVCPRGVLESESQPARADNNNTTLGIPESNLPSLPGYSDSSTPLGQICTCGNLKIFVVKRVWQQWWKCKGCVCNSDRKVGVAAGVEV